MKADIASEMDKVSHDNEGKPLRMWIGGHVNNARYLIVCSVYQVARTGISDLNARIIMKYALPQLSLKNVLHLRTWKLIWIFDCVQLINLKFPGSSFAENY